MGIVLKTDFSLFVKFSVPKVDIVKILTKLCSKTEVLKIQKPHFLGEPKASVVFRSDSTFASSNHLLVRLSMGSLSEGCLRSRLMVLRVPSALGVPVSIYRQANHRRSSFRTFTMLLAWEWYHRPTTPPSPGLIFLAHVVLYYTY